MSEIGIVDTTFASVDMGHIVERTLKDHATNVRTHRYTVPGIKDLAVASKRLLEQGCELVIACGMPGPEAVDKQSAHVASTGLQFAQVMTSKHIVEIFVHLDEAKDENELVALTNKRCSEHAINALALLRGPTALTPRAGTGRRQGFADVGEAGRIRADVDPFKARYQNPADPTNPGSARSAAGSRFGSGTSGNAGKH